MSNNILSTEIVADKTLLSEADDLASEYESFHNDYIVAGRAALYQSLGRMYALTKKLDYSVDKCAQITNMRNILSEKYGIRTQENTSDVAVLVRYITRTDRKTTHVYARAIEAAKANDIPAAQFVEFLDQAGGIERIRADSVAPLLSYQEIRAIENDKDRRLKLSRKYITARTEIPLASFVLNKRHSPQVPQGNAFKQFICYERSGRYYVLAEHDGEVNPEFDLVNLISEKLPPDLSNSSKSINSFYKKAMIKRKHRTIKEISKQRPSLAKRMTAIYERKAQMQMAVKDASATPEVKS